jgi:hypothetical protein
MVVILFPQNRVRPRPLPELPLALSIVALGRTVISLYLAPWIFWDTVLAEMEERFRAR